MHGKTVQGRVLGGRRIASICLLAGLFLAAIHPPVSTAQPGDERSLPLTLEGPQGMAWEGKKLWMVDERTKHLYNLDPATGSVVRSVPTTLKEPRGAAFDGKNLWVGDAGTGTIDAIDPETGRTVKSLKMERPGDKATFEGIAWDGKYLWVAYAAGFSSSYSQIDRESGKVVRSILADCDPRGIASDGEYLYSICSNGPKFPAKIDKRRILDRDHEMLRSRVFIKSLSAKDPSGLAFDGALLWYVDRASRKTFTLAPNDGGK